MKEFGEEGMPGKNGVRLLLSEDGYIKQMAKQFKRHPNQVHGAFESDAEIIRMSPEKWLAISTDHVDFVNDFLIDISFFECGYHSVCVSLSDIAAVGADPEGIVLSICIPAEMSSENIEEFAKGASKAAEKYNTFILGGDTTTRSQFSVTSTVIGFVPPHQALLRKGANPGDYIFLSGSAGRANGRAFACATGRGAAAPKFSIEPRIELGKVLRGLATSCTDTSDGVLAAIENIHRASGGLFEIIDHPDIYDKPSADLLTKEGLPAFPLLIGAAGEYELLFTVAPDKVETMKAACEKISINPLCIGRIHQGDGCVLNFNGRVLELDYDKFEDILISNSSPYEYLKSVLAELKLA